MLDVIQAPQPELSNHAVWSQRLRRPMLPNKPRGVPRVDDRRVLDGIFWVLRSGAPWRDLPEGCGPHTTCYNRFVRWRRAGVWDRIMDALAAAHDAAVQMIDTSVVRVHQHGACIADNREQHMGRSRGGLTSKIHAVGAGDTMRGLFNRVEQLASAAPHRRPTGPSVERIRDTITRRKFSWQFVRIGVGPGLTGVTWRNSPLYAVVGSLGR
jgi:transposase